MAQDDASLSKQYSRRLVAEVLIHDAPQSRAALARSTGLSKQTTSLVIADLEAEGWVRAVGVSKGAVGRSAISYELAWDNALSVGVDLGGAKLSVAIADLAGRTLAEATEPTDRRGGAHVLRQVHDAALRLARTQRIDFSKARSVVVGMPGVVDPASGVVDLVPNIRGLSDVNAPGMLADLFGRPVAVENDVNLAMLGEAWQGCARGAQDAAFLAVGAGVGLGLIVNGKLARGAKGAAGEIAYLPIGSDVVSETARNVGAFELEVGAEGILRAYQAEGGEAPRTVRELFDRLAAGDRAAAAALDATARRLALAATSIAAILDPEIVVLGGSIGARPELAERVRSAMAPLFARAVDIRVSALGSRAGLVGALSLAVTRLHNALFGMSKAPKELSLPNVATAFAHLSGLISQAPRGAAALPPHLWGRIEEGGRTEPRKLGALYPPR
jgi:predicted NBD/HSP70 family sugar kinase